MSEFSEWVVLHRKRLGLNQSALGEKLGCQQTVISSLEKDKINPSQKLLGLLESLFGQTAPPRLPKSKKAKKLTTNYEPLCFPPLEDQG